MNHVAFVIPGLDQVGGAEQQALEVALGLARRGWRVSMVTLAGDGGHAADELRDADIPLHSLSMRRGLADPRGWLRVERWLHRCAPDIVHAHLPHATFLTRWSRLLAPARVVLDTVHSSGTGGRARHWGYRMSNWLADETVFVGCDAAHAWLATGAVPANRQRVIPNGIATQRWTPDPAMGADLRAHLGLGDEFVWLAAGRLERVKDHRTLLEAMTLLPASARLLIAGRGSQESDLRRQAASLRIEGQVRFLGFVSNLLDYMRAADGFVLTSRWEGLPMVLLEAAACGLPAVATDVAGSREVIVPGQTGYLCPPGDAAQLAAAMHYVMQMTPAERRAMGVEARRRTMAKFSLEKTLDRWEKLYEELLLRHAAPVRRAH